MRQILLAISLSVWGAALAAQDAATPAPATPTGEEVTAEALAGADVYGADGETMGRVTEVVFTPEGDVDAAVIAVGGFLGFGRHEAAVPVEDLAVMEKADTDGEMIVQVPMTEEEFKQLPEYAAAPSEPAPSEPLAN
ncbi:MAG: PRC-barrel domain-containing protein [Pseudomonadota bacterium]